MIKIITIAATVAAGLTVAISAAPAQAASAPANCLLSGTSGRAALDANGTTIGRVDVLDSSAQVLPARTIGGAASATLCAPRDAYASVQLEVSADHGIALTNVAASASDLVGPGGATLSGTAAGAAANIRFAREDYVTLGRLSDAELDPAAGSPDRVTPAASRVSRNPSTGACTDTADACRFPDILVPDRDALAGQTRNAFRALRVPSGENRVIWTDVFVPATAPPGTYTGTIAITQTAGRPVVVPVQLFVAPVTLPATSTTHGTFFYNGQDAHGGTDYQQAAELGLDDRITVVPQGAISTSPSVVTTIMGPLLNGTDSHVELTDADGRHATLTDLPMNATDGAGYFDTYKPLFTATTRTTPWAYCDEVGYDVCGSLYDASAAKRWPGLPLLAVRFESGSSPWGDPQNAVVPGRLTAVTGGVVEVIQHLHPTYQGWHPANFNADLGDRSPNLRAWVAGARGRQAWAYTANMSGNTGAYSSSQVYTGFPSLGIDQVASEQQAMGWILFVDGLQGQLYWSVDQSPSARIDAAQSGLSGDGALFYPYDATTVGGTMSIPLESIRLKRIRNGQQDNELLTLATAQGRALPDGRTARSIATALIPAVSATAVTPAVLDAAEQDLIRLFPVTTTTPPAVAAHDLDCSGTPDFLAVAASSGDLLFYPRGTSDWRPDAPITVAHGFAAAGYTGLLLPGDVNGDGAPDLVARKPDGSLWLMPGHCTGAFDAATSLGLTATEPAAVGDFTGDGRPDLLDKRSDGTLFLLAGTGAGFTSRGQDGAGWAALQIIGAGDVDGDGAADVVARNVNDGTVLLYRGTGTGGWKSVDGGGATGLTLTTASYPRLLAVGDLSGDGRADLVAVGADGTMWLFAGTGSGTFASTPTRIGSGWQNQNLVLIAQ